MKKRGREVIGVSKVGSGFAFNNKATTLIKNERNISNVLGNLEGNGCKVSYE
jgi:hypothetical protein